MTVIKFFRNIYLSRRFFEIAVPLTFLMMLGFVWPVLTDIAFGLFALLIIFVVLDAVQLYSKKGTTIGRRMCADMFSNGDDNEVYILIENKYTIPISIQILEEAPSQFQMRDLTFNLNLAPAESQTINYQLCPTQRGTYNFGNINLMVKSKIELITRRYQLGGGQEVKVYPSILQMKKADLMLFSQNHMMRGLKKIRRAGQNMEFEEIREYNLGDDFRRINWKATARNRSLMLNVFQEEKSRPVYSIINKGRTMQMPFDGMTLFDYAVNTSLAITNIILKRSDKAGLITFEKRVDTFLAADSRKKQLKTILELLYNEQTNFAEPNYYDLFTTIRRKISQRSMLLLYTNFESHSSLEQQLPLFKKLSRSHLLVVVFFENTELSNLMNTKVNSISDAYQVSIAEKFDMEKRVIQKELLKNGIHSLLTKPESLTVDTINKYLEIKARGLL